MECCGILVQAVDWAMLEPEVLRLEMVNSEVLIPQALGLAVLRSAVLRSVLAGAKEAMATKEI